jgi:uncharacterized membrane protein YecN with MAPEG domain
MGKVESYRLKVAGYRLQVTRLLEFGGVVLTPRPLSQREKGMFRNWLGYRLKQARMKNLLS